MSRSAGRLFVTVGIAVALLSIPVAIALELGTGPTRAAAAISDLHRSLLLVAVPIAVLVEGAIVYAVWRFRNNDDPKSTPEDRRLELTWTVATGLVLVFVGVASYQVLAMPDVTATADPDADATADALELEVTAQQWYWSVEYEGEDVFLDRADRIVLPTNRTVRITLRSTDVIHSFHAPSLGLKQDVIPGHRRLVVTRVTRPGEYRLYCAEYCGRGHSSMQATIEVVSPEEYRDWLADRRNGTATGSS